MLNCALTEAQMRNMALIDPEMLMEWSLNKAMLNKALIHPMKALSTFSI